MFVATEHPASERYRVNSALHSGHGAFETEAQQPVRPERQDLYIGNLYVGQAGTLALIGLTCRMGARFLP